MKILHERCAGLDVHKDTVVAAFRVADGGDGVFEVDTFGTTTPELLRLLDWLESRACTHAAMESTGVYWKPVWHILEDSCSLILANAADIKNMPGRKSDISDAQWIADLLAHGLIRPSLVPTAHQAEMRLLTRTRKQIVREVGQHVQRIQKTLEDANIKLASVVSDIQGVAARRILDEIVKGTSNAMQLASLADNGRLKASHDELVAALTGHVREHHRFDLALHLRIIDALHKEIASVEGRIEERISSFRVLVDLLVTIPGWSSTTAHTFLAEVGDDMSRFPNDAHLISWARLCPRNDETAGKRRSRRTLKGNSWLKPALIQAAWAATRANGTYPQSLFRRLRAKTGPKKAIVAVAASLLQAAFHIVMRRETYRDLGADYFVAREKPRIANRLVKRLRDLGYVVQLAQVTAN